MYDLHLYKVKQWAVKVDNELFWVNLFWFEPFDNLYEVFLHTRLEPIPSVSQRIF